MSREDVLYCLFACAVLTMVDEFALARPEEALATGVVPAGASMAHAGGDAVLAEPPLVAIGCILAAAIRVVQHSPAATTVG